MNWLWSKNTENLIGYIPPESYPVIATNTNFLGIMGTEGIVIECAGKQWTIQTPNFTPFNIYCNELVLNNDSEAYVYYSAFVNPSSYSEELIQNITTGTEFYLDKRVSYGEILVLTFLMIFLIFGIVKFLTEFFIPKLVNFRRK